MNWERWIYIGVIILLIIALLFSVVNNRYNKEDNSTQQIKELTIERDYYKSQLKTTCRGLNTAIDIIHLYDEDSKVKPWDCETLVNVY